MWFLTDVDHGGSTPSGTPETCKNNQPSTKKYMYKIQQYYFQYMYKKQQTAIIFSVQVQKTAIIFLIHVQNMQLPFQYMYKTSNYIFNTILYKNSNQLFNACTKNSNHLFNTSTKPAIIFSVHVQNNSNHLFTDKKMQGRFILLAFIHFVVKVNNIGFFT